MPRATEILAIALLAVAVGACSTGARRSSPPPVSQCLDEPAAHVADEPVAIEEGKPITDEYVVALKAYANSLLGVITQDRIAWRGERRCVRRLVDAELIR